MRIVSIRRQRHSTKRLTGIIGRGSSYMTRVGCGCVMLRVRRYRGRMWLEQSPRRRRAQRCFSGPAAGRHQWCIIVR